MAISKKLEDESSRSALFISTMRVIDSHVHVHIIDGSVFSGILYTVSVDNEFDIILKNAKLTKKGRSKSNVSSGKTVETLVIQFSNIVQIVAEGVSIPADVAGNTHGENVEPAMADLPCDPRSCIVNKSIKSGIDRRGTNHRRNSSKVESRLENSVRTLTSGKDQKARGLSSSCTTDVMKEPGRRNEINVTQNKHHPSLVSHQRQAGAHILKRSKQNGDIHQEDNVDAQSSSSSRDSTSEHVKPKEQEKIMPEPSSNGFHNVEERPSSTENLSSHSTALDENSEMSQGLVASTNKLLPTQPTEPVKNAKEFKLNPGAKIFSPSLTKRLPSIPAETTPAVATVGYVPSNTPMLPVPEAVQPEIGINPFFPQASPPSKFVPYTNLAPGNAGGGSFFPQNMVGPTINRGQPHRSPSQYHSVQATPMLVNPSPQMMVGRSGQLMYMQPISQDLVQGAPHPSLLPSHPLFAAQQQFQYPKHQVLIPAGQQMQLYAPQPFPPTGPQSYAVMPTDIPVMQASFPTNRSIPIPVPNGFFGTKYP